MTTTTVNAPKAEPEYLFEDPDRKACDLLTNVREGNHEYFPLTEAELALLPGEDSVRVAENIVMNFGESGILNGKRVFIVNVEYLYRNDVSRHKWGTPVTLELGIKSTMEQQTKEIKRSFAKAFPQLDRFGGTASMSFREYLAEDGGTDDRHILNLYIPIEAMMTHPLTIDEFVNYCKQLVTPVS